MKKIILASNNAHKVEEIKGILKGMPFEVSSLKDEMIDVDVIEDGKTFEENAKKKAKEIVEFLNNRGDENFLVMADDSGLEVDYLNGEPGIYSARYAGGHGDDEKNNIKLLENLKGVPREKRGANFVCQIALMDGKNKYLSIRGDVRGVILESLSGKGGFGYDPLFFYEPLSKTFGELSGNEKNEISHRGVALKRLKSEILDFINE